MNTKTLIVAAIAIVLVVLGGIVFTQSNTHVQDNATSYLIPLKAADLGYIQIDTPENSKFEIKNRLNESDKGMVYFKNTGNYSAEIEGIVINKNLTGQLISQNMKLDSVNNNTKIYKSNSIYQLVKTVNDTDIILTGKDIHVLSEMASTITVKDTKNLTSPVKTEKTEVEKVVDKNKEVKKAKKETPKVEKTQDKQQNAQNNKPNVETTRDNKADVETTSENKSNVETTTDDKSDVETTTQNVVKKSEEPLYIGGGIFKTGSALEDKTIAKIYVGGEHAGDTVKIKIKYYRDGDSLNEGNLVTKTVDGNGYIEVSSADSYSKFPDKAYMELYDADGVLQATQTVTLTPDSTTQYF